MKEMKYKEIILNDKYFKESGQMSKNKFFMERTYTSVCRIATDIWNFAHLDVLKVTIMVL
jgi:hypothetical protein